jgi:hypothetical protein
MFSFWKMAKRKQKSASRKLKLQRVVSGGQTGVDRAALDAALAGKIPIGGWCPRGRRSEDGQIPASYNLKETAARSYAVRTEWNVRDSDGTLVIVQNKVTGGTRLTVDLARRHSKPVHVVYLHGSDAGELFLDGNSRQEQLSSVVDWLVDHRIRVLNVAGPRASSNAEIYSQALDFLSELLGV